MQGTATLSEYEKAVQALLDWLTDGEPLTTEEERESYESDGRAVARTVLDVAA